jgi:hypothetical protein
MSFKDTNLAKLQKVLISKNCHLVLSRNFVSENNVDQVFTIRIYKLHSNVPQTNNCLTIYPVQSDTFIQEAHGYTVEDACSLLLDDDFRKTKEVQLY